VLPLGGLGGVTNVGCEVLTLPNFYWTTIEARLSREVTGGSNCSICSSRAIYTNWQTKTVPVSLGHAYWYLMCSPACSIKSQGRLQGHLIYGVFLLVDRPLGHTSLNSYVPLHRQLCDTEKGWCTTTVYSGILGLPPLIVSTRICQTFARHHPRPPLPTRNHPCRATPSASISCSSERTVV